MKAIQCCILFVVCVCCGQGFGQASLPVNLNDPILATLNGHEITLKETEEFARELPSNQRVPWHLKGAGEWRKFIARDLAKVLVFSKDAMALGRHLDPAFLRGREYFVQEYLSYLMLRDFVYNKIDVSRERHEEEFRTHHEDYVVTPTVMLRYIRSRNADAVTSAAARIAAGEDFVAVERVVSEVSPRYIGRVLGPFPAEESRTMIPPPAPVVEAANQQEIGQTTGPLQVGAFHFLVKTEAKKRGGYADIEEVTERIEDRLRQRQGGNLVRDLLTALKRELGVEVDEALLARRENTRANDVIATVGAVRITRQEFEDLNGRVRGPAAAIASGESTRLRAFIVPTIFAEAAKMRGYLKREETVRALKYYDLQHLATWYVDREVISTTPDPTERELRFRFAQHFQELKRSNRGTTPTFEAERANILEAMQLERRPMAEARFVDRRLSSLGFKVNMKQPCARITAFEGLVHAAKSLPENARILEITEARGKEDGGDDWYLGIGRNTAWRIIYDIAGAGGSSEELVEGPALLNDGSFEFTSTPLYAPLYNTWKYDTDSLFRYAIDRGMADFAAKHNNQVQIVSRVEFAYDKDVPTSATDCLVSYIATPLDDSVHDGLIIKYSAITGEITKRRAGDPEGQCPTCPAPDLPATSIREQAEGRTGSAAAVTTSTAETTSTSAGVSAVKP